MNIKHLRVGVIHSLIGKNDGVSIVIDQMVNAMVDYMGIELGSIFFLAAHSSPRFNAETNDIFWHKNLAHRTAIKQFQNPNPPEYLDELIDEKAQYARDVIKEWVERNDIDLIIPHNTSHPYNMITAVGLGYYIQELRKNGTVWPKVMVWWHDSYFERPIFAKPNKTIKKYLKYLPGNFIDGIAFINNSQVDIAKKLYDSIGMKNQQRFFDERVEVVPNTTDIPWDWSEKPWYKDELIYPKQDNYNDSFFLDIGLVQQVEGMGFSIDNTVILLQHTRIVPRKRIELAIDLAFQLEKKYKADKVHKCVAVLVSGHSGDEQEAYKEFLQEHYEKMLEENPGAKVVLNFGESSILSHRDIIVDKKYYKFAEVPSIVAAKGGIGTYFSEIEGFGNNLLEMLCLGLPVVINEYDIYKQEISQLGFQLPSIDNCELTDELVDQAYELLTDLNRRNWVIHHNLLVLKRKLDHKIIAEKLTGLIKNMFTKTL